MGRSDARGRSTTVQDRVPFHGRQQAGIATATQEQLAFGSFDVTIEDRGQLASLLHAWTIAAAAMTSGAALTEVEATPAAPPLDTGEALGLAAANLTVTFGFGSSLFERDGKERFGLRSRRPALLRPLGPLPGDELDAARSDGDICVQACADDPQVAFHAIRNLARIGRGIVVLRWMQLGFGRTSSTTTGQTTPHNLHGFKDGTRNVLGDDQASMSRHVWVPESDAQPWMRNGSYLVARRIRMLIEHWDRSSLDDQSRRSDASRTPVRPSPASTSTIRSTSLPRPPMEHS